MALGNANGQLAAECLRNQPVAFCRIVHFFTAGAAPWWATSYALGHIGTAVSVDLQNTEKKVLTV